MYKHFYSEFLKHHKGKLHFAAHSHHFWPDVTRRAQLDYWDDSAKLSDDKWPKIFGEIIPETQKLIGKILNLKHPEMITFAPNTHELLTRLFSCLDWTKEIRLLTTDSEFHSFKRQSERLIETGKLHVEIIPTEPFETLSERLIKKIQSESYDMIFLSQVFFNSGVLIEDLEEMVESTPDKTMFVVDGYHAFMAVETNLSELEGKIFYLSGGYKYAQAGEGACFLISPKNCQLRPIYTGWFSSFSTLESSSQKINYDSDAFRFMGSTFDPSGIYRLRSVLRLFDYEKLSVYHIHQYVSSLQTYFLENLRSKVLTRESLLSNNLDHHGHFLTFRLASQDVVKSVHEKLKQHGVITDYRGDRLRFGFGLYQDSEDVENLLEIISTKL
jgi:selenocysteine lyase/cysteine desulfurase